MKQLLKEYISRFVLNEIHAKTFDWIATLISRIIIADIHAHIRSAITKFRDSQMHPMSYSDELPGTQHAELKGWLVKMPRGVKVIKYDVAFYSNNFAYYMYC